MLTPLNALNNLISSRIISPPLDTKFLIKKAWQRLFAVPGSRLQQQPLTGCKPAAHQSAFLCLSPHLQLSSTESNHLSLCSISTTRSHRSSPVPHLHTVLPVGLSASAGAAGRKPLLGCPHQAVPVNRGIVAPSTRQPLQNPRTIQSRANQASVAACNKLNWNEEEESFL